MAGRHLIGLLLVATASVLLSPSRGQADLLRFWKWKRCPPPSYPVCHYCTPELYRIWACFCGPKISQEAVFRYPELPLVIHNHPYPCPPVDPAEYYSPYLLPVPGSTYAKESKTDAGKTSPEPPSEPIPAPTPVAPKEAK